MITTEKPTLQDVKGFYHWKQFRLNFGQFVPHYSLQRFQHDFNIPMAERAAVINALIPDGTLEVRDIGIEGYWQNKNKTIESWLGIFNGNGIKEYRLKARSQKLNVMFVVSMFLKDISG